MIDMEITRVATNSTYIYQKMMETESKNVISLGSYMIKAGLVSDHIYGGAFSLLIKLEGTTEMYHPCTNEPPKVASEIVYITECAMNGLYDGFAYTKREIRDILLQFRAFKGKGGK